MTTSEDVKTLFRRFGGQAETYQEVVREDLAEHSLGKWPMLGQVNLQKVDLIPAAKQTIKTVATRPYSESLAVAQAGQIAVADYVASHSNKYVEPVREAPPVVAAPYVPPAPPPQRQEAAQVRVEPVSAPIFAAAPLVASPVQAVVQAPFVSNPVTHMAAPVAIRVAAPMPAPPQVAPVQATSAEPLTSLPRMEQAVSGLAARFRAQAAAIVEPPAPQVAELPPQSLHGLFGRLAQSQVKAQSAAGLLKRKLIK